MPRPKAHRFPWQPVERRLVELRLPASSNGADSLCERMGVHPREVTRWKAQGLTDVYADRVALALSTMPGELWPDWYAVGLEVDTRTAQERKRALWRAQAAKKRWRQANAAKQAGWNQEYRLTLGPEAKAAKAAAQKRWYAANAERERERARRVYAENRDRIRARHAAYYQANRVRLDARSKERREAQRAEQRQSAS